MLQKLSYFNLLLAIVYLLVYLRSGNFNSTSGILMIVIFSWLGLRSYQFDDYKWKAWHYLTGTWSLYYIAILVYGSINVLITVIETDYISTDTLTYLVLSFLFSIAVLLHFIFYFLRNRIA